jgi:hypothetical protein
VPGFEAQAREPVHEHADRDRQLRPREEVADAVMRTDGEGQVRPLRSMDIELVGRGTPDLTVSVRGRDHEDRAGVGRERHATERRARRDAAQEIADRRRPAQSFLHSCRDQRRVGAHRGELVRVAKEAVRDRRAAVRRLLQAAEKDQLERRHDEREPLLERAVDRVDEVADQAVVRRGEPAANSGVAISSISAEIAAQWADFAGSSS